MIRALYSSASGMFSQQLNLDNISHNLANVNTSGYKKNKLEFQDLLYQTTRTAGADSGGGNLTPTGLQIGHGSRPVTNAKIFTTGEIIQTTERFDLAINGDGFLRINLVDGSQGYTRAGALKTDNTGRLMTSDGLLLADGITLPENYLDVTVSRTGIVSAKTAAGTSTLGQINLYRFSNPAGLDAIGGNLFRATEVSGEPVEGTPGSEGFGDLVQYSLEMSNVKVVEEMVNMIVAQRAYEVNSKAVQAADEMMQISNNIRR